MQGGTGLCVEFWANFPCICPYPWYPISLLIHIPYLVPCTTGIANSNPRRIERSKYVEVQPFWAGHDTKLYGSAHSSFFVTISAAQWLSRRLLHCVIRDCPWPSPHRQHTWPAPCVSSIHTSSHRHDSTVPTAIQTIILMNEHKALCTLCFWCRVGLEASSPSTCDLVLNCFVLLSH